MHLRNDSQQQPSSPFQPFFPLGVKYEGFELDKTAIYQSLANLSSVPEARYFLCQEIAQAFVKCLSEPPSMNEEMQKTSSALLIPQEGKDLVANYLEEKKKLDTYSSELFQQIEEYLPADIKRRHMLKMNYDELMRCLEDKESRIVLKEQEIDSEQAMLKLTQLRLNELKKEADLLAYCQNQKIFDSYVNGLGSWFTVGERSLRLYVGAAKLPWEVWRKGENQTLYRLPPLAFLESSQSSVSPEQYLVCEPQGDGFTLHHQASVVFHGDNGTVELLTENETYRLALLPHTEEVFARNNWEVRAKVDQQKVMQVAQRAAELGDLEWLDVLLQYSPESQRHESKLHQKLSKLNEQLETYQLHKSLLDKQTHCLTTFCEMLKNAKKKGALEEAWRGLDVALTNHATTIVNYELIRFEGELKKQNNMLTDEKLTSMINTKRAMLSQKVDALKVAIPKGTRTYAEASAILGRLYEQYASLLEQEVILLETQAYLSERLDQLVVARQHYLAEKDIACYQLAKREDCPGGNLSRKEQFEWLARLNGVPIDAVVNPTTGDSLLHVAIKSQQFAVARYLLLHGAKLMQQNKLVEGGMEHTKVTGKAAMAINTQGGAEQNTWLHACIKQGNFFEAAYLVRYGSYGAADLTIRNRDGMTPVRLQSDLDPQDTLLHYVIKQIMTAKPSKCPWGLFDYLVHTEIDSLFIENANKETPLELLLKFEEKLKPDQAENAVQRSDWEEQKKLVESFITFIVLKTIVPQASKVEILSDSDSPQTRERKASVFQRDVKETVSNHIERIAKDRDASWLVRKIWDINAKSLEEQLALMEEIRQELLRSYQRQEDTPLLAKIEGSIKNIQSDSPFQTRYFGSVRKQLNQMVEKVYEDFHHFKEKDGSITVTRVGDYAMITVDQYRGYLDKDAHAKAQKEFEEEKKKLEAKKEEEAEKIRQKAEKDKDELKEVISTKDQMLSAKDEEINDLKKGVERAIEEERRKFEEEKRKAIAEERRKFEEEIKAEREKARKEVTYEGNKKPADGEAKKRPTLFFKRFK